MNNNSLANFVWPEYKNDKERIKFFSRKYKDVGICEAFASEYNLKVNLPEQSSIRAELVPIEPVVGDVMDLMITSIDKNKVTFDAINLKKEVSSKVNLYRYDFFKQFVPKQPVKVMVTEVDKNKIMVDPITPLIDGWLCNYSGNKLYQKNINEPKPVIVKNL